jgi:acid phosphatase
MTTPSPTVSPLRISPPCRHDHYHILPPAYHHLRVGVQAILIGGAVPEDLRGTTDDTYYSHYSTISTVAMNWGLPQLGRWDCGANVFEIVANKTGYKNSVVDLDGLSFNQSYPGPVSDALYTPGFWAAPNTMAKCASGMGVLPAIKAAWGNTTGDMNYTNVFPYSEPGNINTGAKLVTGFNDRNDSTSASGNGSDSGNSTSSDGDSAAAGISVPGAVTVVALAGMTALFL